MHMYVRTFIVNLGFVDYVPMYISTVFTYLHSTNESLAWLFYIQRDMRTYFTCVHT
jgi:hypothetical protein